MRALIPLMLIALVACEDDKAGSGDKKGVQIEALPKGAAATLVLHEGLPHQHFEAELLKKELADKKTRKIGDHAFYKETLGLEAGVADKLIGILSNGANYRPIPEGMAKACGGFHPDYAIQWSEGGEMAYALVCFGCDEIKFARARAPAHYDLAPGASRQLKALLSPHRKNRPKRR